MFEPSQVGSHITVKAVPPPVPGTPSENEIFFVSCRESYGGSQEEAISGGWRIEDVTCPR